MSDYIIENWHVGKLPIQVKVSKNKLSFSYQKSREEWTNELLYYFNLIKNWIHW